MSNLTVIEGREALVAQQAKDAIAQAVLKGDLSKLPPELKTTYYQAVCASIGANPATQPFLFLTFNNKEILYPSKGLAEQLRKIYAVSLSGPKITFEGSMVLVEITATMRNGRTDTDLGIVDTSAGLNKGLSKGDATLKAITKAKRRVTFSILGLGYLDAIEQGVESDGDIPLVPVDIDDIPTAQLHGVEYMDENDLTLLGEAAKAAGLTKQEYQGYLMSKFPNRSRGEFDKARLGDCLDDFSSEEFVAAWKARMNPPVAIA